MTLAESSIEQQALPRAQDASQHALIGEFSVAELSEDSIGEVSSPYSSDEREVSRGVQAVIELQQLAILRMLARMLVLLVAPILVTVSVARLLQGKEIQVALAMELSFLMLAVFAAFRESMLLATRRRLTVLGLIGLSISSLLQFGPLIGTGFVFIAALLGSSLLLRPREAYFGGSLLILAMAMPTLGAFGVWGQPFHFPGPALDAATWLRLLVSCAAGVIGILYIFLRLQRSLRVSFEKEIGLRIRERRLVSEREKVLRRAASSQRLESLGRLAGGIAHDFNNALVVIQCGIDSLNEELDQAEHDEVLQELEQAVDRAAGTARQLLSFAKRNVEELGTAQPAQVLERLTKESRRLLPAHVQCNLVLNDPPRVGVSEPALEQLVLNLLQNARDALLVSGGTIEIRAGLDAKTGGLHLSVSDDGPGMDPEVAERAFEPFFTTKGDHGAGLGLATVWGMVHRLGGDVSLRSRLGEGTRVSIRLPASNETAVTAGAGPSQPPLSPLPGGQRPRVLVLEDEAPVRSALRRILAHIGFEVHEASTVAEARTLSKERTFSLLLSDGVVPDGGVGGFIAEFRARQRHAPVILCSGYLEEDLALQGIAQGECVFLAKPFSAQDLCRVVAQLLPGVLIATPASTPS